VGYKRYVLKTIPWGTMGPRDAEELDWYQALLVSLGS
jgi:hypothetical protein